MAILLMKMAILLMATDLEFWRSIKDTTANLLNRELGRAEGLYPPGCTRGCIGGDDFSPLVQAAAISELNDVEKRLCRPHLRYVFDQFMQLCSGD
jgi:hypothetical protein